jgi:pseudaminic acid biosynthesis-associated protein PseG
MRIAFRVDASLRAGRGHLSRCLTLANYLRQLGAKVLFICRRDPAVHDSVFTNGGFEVAWLPALLRPEQRVEISMVDAEQTREVLSIQGEVDWLIVDHYELDERWESRVRSYTKRLMVIDDLADRPHVCDLLIDQTYGADADRYAGLIPGDCHVLLGSSYALLRPEFAEMRATMQQPESYAGPLKVHVFFGSGDPENYTQRYSNWLLSSFPNLSVKAAVGLDYEACETLIALNHGYEARFEWERGVTDMARHMAMCQVAVGAPGIATWERACLGLPAAYLSIASNQVAVLEHLAAEGFCDFLGAADTCAREEFVEGVSRFLGNPAYLAEKRLLSMSAIDGMGIARVARVMEERLAC